MARLRRESIVAVPDGEPARAPAQASKPSLLAAAMVLMVVVVLLAAGVKGWPVRPAVAGCSGVTQEVGAGFVLTAVRGPAGGVCSGAPAGVSGEEQRLFDESVRAAQLAAAGLMGVDAWMLPAVVSLKGVAGPSGGLLLALEVLDRWHGGELSRGRRIAATGVVLATGEVLPVGGVSLKVAAAERAGVDLLLVPRDNAVEALAVARRAVVVPVATLADAVAALQA